MADLNNSSPLELVTTSFEQSAWMRGFDFMPGTDCLVIWWSDIQQATDVETVSVEQVCPGQPAPQALDVIELPFGSGSYQMSPQGDAFLAVSQDRVHNWHLSIDELGDDAPPRLLFTAPAQEGLSIGPLYWQPDGQQIQFIQNMLHLNGTASLTHYIVSHDGQSVESQQELTMPFVLVTGGWLQDGKEIVFFSGLGDYKPETTGVYIFDLNNGIWRQILAGYYLTRWPAWSPEMPSINQEEITP
ncbi:MAG: hypothetical protein HND44_06975 [Chloroflexi bacterium]|nr:hypothetical protein [Chloroflexota bacterium]